MRHEITINNNKVIIDYVVEHDGSSYISFPDDSPEMDEERMGEIWSALPCPPNTFGMTEEEEQDAVDAWHNSSAWDNITITI